MEVLEYLKQIENAGFEAYIVGGYVRDNILGIKTTDVDITTSATPQEICKIFDISKVDNLGSINIKKSDINIDITTFRKESNYFKHKPKNVTYVDDLLTDLKRRDFTINTLCINSKGEIIDMLGGLSDLENKILKVVGRPKKKFREDPLRMMRALRFSIIYDLCIADKELEFILNNKKLFSEISYKRKKDELGYILVSKNCIKGLNLLKSLNLTEALEIDFDEKITYVNDYIGMWSQINCSDGYQFSKLEMMRMNAIKSIIEYGKIDENVLFKYGKYDALIAGEIMGIDRKKIDEIYDSMKIYSMDELDISGDEIKKLLNIEASPKIKSIKKDLIKEILFGNLSNTKKDISKYIIKKWK